ncbi:MAG TPA: CvpA family protein [Candidatus Dormibacteraeota bacterium]|nr:CvpA family protein [Candidatus Dormibacteraeota bacterium]
MTWVDILPLALIVIYGVLGLFTGVLRRVIGLIAVYIGCIAATGMGLQAANIIQQASTTELPDARIYGFFGLLLVVLLAVDGAAQLAHRQIQIEAIVWNRVSGVLVGILTAVLLSVVVTYELQAAGHPSGGGQLAGTQAQIRAAVDGSKIAVPLVNSLGRPIIAVFQPALPFDPHQYFSRGIVS